MNEPGSDHGTFSPGNEAGIDPAFCDGSAECKSTVHLHGCYSDDGTNCDNPSEHGIDPQWVEIDRLANTVREGLTDEVGRASREAWEALDALTERAKQARTTEQAWNKEVQRAMKAEAEAERLTAALREIVAVRLVRHLDEATAFNRARMEMREIAREALAGKETT